MATKRRYLWLLRHAKTVTDPPDGGTDFDRVLARGGRRDATAIGELFANEPSRFAGGKVPFPEVALVSPAARTAATAELALAHVSDAPTRVLVPDFYGAEPEEVLAHLATLDDAVTSVMVVGHNPTAHSLAIALISSSDKKGATPWPATVSRRVRSGSTASVSSTGATCAPRTARLAGIYIPPFG